MVSTNAKYINKLVTISTVSPAATVATAAAAATYFARVFFLFAQLGRKSEHKL